MEFRFGVWNPSSGKELNPTQSRSPKDSNARSPVYVPVTLKDKKLGQTLIVRSLSFGKKSKDKVVRESQLSVMVKV
jgi:hypothetical protein